MTPEPSGASTLCVRNGPSTAPGLSLLHLFSGPADRSDGMAAFVRKAGGQCRDIDIVNKSQGDSQQHDLSDDTLWLSLFRDLKDGQFTAVFAGTPCTTFSAARTGPPGPRPLRNHDNPYGLPKSHLSIKEADEVRLGTYFALKSVEFLSVAREQDMPSALENP